MRYLLEENPGLQSHLADAVTKVYPQAVDLAAQESELPIETFPRQCLYTEAQIPDPDFYPTVE